MGKQVYMDGFRLGAYVKTEHVPESIPGEKERAHLCIGQLKLEPTLFVCDRFDRSDTGWAEGRYLYLIREWEQSPQLIKESHLARDNGLDSRGIVASDRHHH
jgi:hypothetical protein